MGAGVGRRIETPTRQVQQETEEHLSPQRHKGHKEASRRALKNPPLCSLWLCRAKDAHASICWTNLGFLELLLDRLAQSGRRIQAERVLVVAARFLPAAERRRRLAQV